MAPREHFKNHHQEIRTFAYRTIFVAFLMLLMLLGLLARYYYLQVVQHEKYVTKADDNRILVQVVPPTRGLIYDRNGELLADNRPSYTLTVVPERVADIEAMITTLRTLIILDENDIKQYKRSAKQRDRRPYQPVPLRYQLTEQEIALIAVNENSLPGLSVEAQLVRYYPKSELYAHTVGYVGKISNRDIKKFDELERERYKSLHLIGKIGLERYYEDTLLGEVGYLHVEKNATSRILRTLQRKPPVPGKDLSLHVDSRLQQKAMTIMEGKRGAVVVMDVKTGGILAMVSTPTYNPNLFVTGISHTDYNRLRDDIDSPQLNRVIQGRYPPASTVKPMLGLAGLKYDVVTPEYRYFDPGYFRIENDKRKYRDWKRGGHGWVNLHKAIVQSSDTYYYNLANMMGIDQIHSFGLEFGLGKRAGIDLPSENAGIWPSRSYKAQISPQPWFPGDSLNTGIGQGYSLATPLQLAVMTTTLASKGKRFKPHLVKAIGDKPVAPEIINTVEASEAQWQVIFDAMRDVVHARNGTAKRVNKDIAYEMAGKTGTAQVVGIAQNALYDSAALKERQRDHGLFIGFAPLNDPQIAVSVFIENGESGSGAAAPVARQMMDTYLVELGHLNGPASSSAKEGQVHVN